MRSPRRHSETSGLTSAPNSRRLPTSIYVGKNSIQLIQAVIGDDELAFAALRMLYDDFSAELFAQLTFKLGDVWIGLRRLGQYLAVFQHASHQCFCLAHRQAFLYY